MKKFMVLFLLCGLILSGCGSSDSGKTVVKYLAWDTGTEEQNNIERQMIKEFEDKNPDVKVEILTPPTKSDGTAGDYNEYMNSLASKGDLPDVFMWSSVSEAVAKDWALDVTDKASKDSDYLDVVAAVRQGSEINDKVFGIPYRLNLKGMTINKDIYNELNVEPLKYGYSLDDLVSAIAATTTDKYRGVDELLLQDWGPTIMNSNLQYGTFDGEKYNFSSPEFAEAMATYQEIVSKGYTGNPNYVDAESWLPDGITWPWGKGYIANQFDGTWSLGSIKKGEIPFKGDFVGLPDGKVVVVPDYIFVSQNSKNKDIAFDLAKFMGYGKNGLDARADIQKKTDSQDDIGLPLNAGKDAKADEAFLENYQQFPEFVKAYEALSADDSVGLLEGYKLVPGFPESRFTAETSVSGVVKGEEKSLTMDELITAIVKGEKQLADYATAMDELANQKYEEAVKAIQNK